MAFPELINGYKKNVLGYCDPLSIVAGKKLRFKLSTQTPGPVEIELVRLISGDDRPHGTGLIEEKVLTDLPKQIDLDYQKVVSGSYAYFDMPEVHELELVFLFHPTLLKDQAQTLFNFSGLRLSFSKHGFRLESKENQIEIKLQSRLDRWYRVELSSGRKTITFTRLPVGPGEKEQRDIFSIEEILHVSAGTWYLACLRPGSEHFNGRLEGFLIKDSSNIVASWDFSRDIPSNRVLDTSGNERHGQLRQTPTRGIRGFAWDGTVQSWVDNPEHYAAIHFHEDDLTDADWEDSLVWRLPEDLPSGQYALKLVQHDSEDYVVFFVRPSLGQKKSEILYLVPTATYLAYANHRMNLGEGGGMASISKSLIRNANDAYLHGHKELGYSLYEHHDDGSGVHMSSRHRPILNLKPRNGTWAFNADTHITAWLETRPESYDVLTDEDLHLEGFESIKDYRVIITGTHPEYWSTAMLDGLEEWLEKGGRLMYMGGNGFYWRIAYDPNDAGIIEVRRSEDGVRAWIAKEGEYYHQFSEEYGGLWRRLGRPPNRLVGVGFAAQGFDGGTYYRVQKGALEKRAAFIVKDLETIDDVWGNFGNQGGGAAGEEIDRWDESLGSPSHAIILASSENHRPGMLRVKEELFSLPAPASDSRVRADMTFFETASGGAVFSTGSISYAGSLSHNEYENNIAQITNNVLDRFIDPEPFEFPN